MNRNLLIAALALPLAGLAANVALNEAQLTQATVWEIPVSGYDPRDILRGNYIRFQYDWTVRGDISACANGSCEFCLINMPPDGAVVEIRTPEAICRHPVDPDASALNVGVGGRIVDDDGTIARPDSVTVSGRYLVSEQSAPKLEGQLADGPMMMRARLTRVGRLMNEELIPEKETDR